MRWYFKMERHRGCPYRLIRRIQRRNQYVSSASQWVSERTLLLLLLLPLLHIAEPLTSRQRRRHGDIAAAAAAAVNKRDKTERVIYIVSQKNPRGLFVINMATVDRFLPHDALRWCTVGICVGFKSNCTKLRVFVSRSHNIGNLVHGEHPKKFGWNRGGVGYGCSSQQKTCNICETVCLELWRLAFRAWLLKLVVNVGEHQTEMNGIARFPCNSTAFLY